ncbi:MAG: tRNA (N6-isopentenyl adenosine(37)-C2)-methylthiotransferase MiaB [Candidatus Gracilibacteria bacterium]|nr:tRNA (N6-isopentenyl adenosine(37)-C2)-methylthiotransferase MiaB [Candidatus Gracilibacteria bacterium]
MNYLIYTYGCQMNYSDSERMETYLEALCLTKAKSEKEADIILFNTCSIREKGEQRVLGKMVDMIKLRKKNKKLIVVITGCMVRKSSSRYSEKRDKLFNRSREIDIALRIEELPKLADLIKELDPKIKLKKIKEETLEDYFHITPHFTSKSQAFIPISTGCDKFCTYCIVPFSRGREKSRPMADILKECEEFVKQGGKEITLLGQTVDSYGLSIFDKQEGTFKDLPKGKTPFVNLLEQIDKLYSKGLRRLRFTSSHPKDISDDLILAHGKLKTLMPYLHLPVQAGSNSLLKRMNRPYTVEKYLGIIKKLRKTVPDIAISTDLIVGFCGETEEEFKETYDLFKKVEFDFCYFAQYSDRKGTYASKNLKDDIPKKVKLERWHAINELLKKIVSKKLPKFIGKTVEVLVEFEKAGMLHGYSEHYKEVQFKGPKSIIGQIVQVKITKATQWVLEGEITK